MSMKKILVVALCFALMISAVAVAEGGIDVARQSVRGNASFTPESYQTVWITPVFDDHIITGTDPEKYPAKFLTFPAPDGGAMLEYNYDESDFLNHDTLMAYYYFAYDRASYELFLERAEEEHIMKDGSDGVAMFVEPDARRARAMFDLTPYFGGTSKMEIILSDHSRDITTDQLKTMIEAETDRVMGAIQVEEPGKFWSEGVFNSVEIDGDREKFKAVVDTKGLTVTRIEPKKVVTKVADGRNASETEISIDTYSYAAGHENGKAAALADGTSFIVYNSDYTGYASFVLTEEGERGDPVYMTIKIDVEPAGFPAALEEAYARVEVSSVE